MPLLLEEANKLATSDFVRGVIVEIIDKDDLFAVLPFVKTTGKSFDYNREDEIAGGSWIDPNEEVKESASTFTEVSTKLRILIGDVDIDKFIAGQLSNEQSQVIIQIKQKAKGLRRDFQTALITGDSKSGVKTFDGVQKLVDEKQVIYAGSNDEKTPASLTMAKLDELCDMVPNGADILLMRSGTKRALRSLLRATYGTDAVMQMLPNFGAPMLTHNGIPILVNNYIPSNIKVGDNEKTTSIFAIRLNEVDGLHGLYGGDKAGIVYENIGTVQNKDAIRMRLKWYCGLALKSTRSLAELKGVTNV